MHVLIKLYMHSHFWLIFLKWYSFTSKPTRTLTYPLGTQYGQLFQSNWAWSVQLSAALGGPVMEVGDKTVTKINPKDPLPV